MIKISQRDLQSLRALCAEYTPGIEQIVRRSAEHPQDEALKDNFRGDMTKDDLAAILRLVNALNDVVGATKESNI